MKKYLGMVKGLDQRPSPFCINFNSAYTYRSYIGGVLSLIYFVTLLSIFSFKMVDLVSRKHVSFTTKTIKMDDIMPLDVGSGDFRLVLYKTGGGLERIKFTDYGRYGVKPKLTESYVLVMDGKRVDGLNVHDLVACTTGQFREYEACFPNITLNILGRLDFTKNKSDGEKLRSFYLELQPCNTSTHSECEPFSEQLKFLFSFDNNFVDPNATHHNDTIHYALQERVFQSHSRLRKDETIWYFLDFKRITIQTYTSIWPQIIHNSAPEETSETWLYDEQSQETNFKNSDGIFLSILLRRSTESIVYTRKYDRFDGMLGEVFGLMGFIGAGIFGLYAGYNGWAFEQVMRKKLGLTYIQPTIFRYYGTVLRKLCICCKHDKQEEMEEAKELCQYLDYTNVIKDGGQDMGISTNKNTNINQQHQGVNAHENGWTILQRERASRRDRSKDIILSRQTLNRSEYQQHENFNERLLDNNKNQKLEEYDQAVESSKINLV